MSRISLRRPSPAVLCVLALALVALVPTAATAKPKGTDRPRRGAASGIVTGILTSPLGITVDLSGNVTHLGKFSVHIDALGVISAGGVEGGGPFTVVAANGDRLTGTSTLNGTEPPSPALTPWPYPRTPTRK